MTPLNAKLLTQAAVFAVCVLFTADNALSFPWSLDMWVQPSSDPYEKPVLHPQKSVTGKTPAKMTREDTEAVAESPVPPTARSIRRGKEIFSHNCVSCHGPKGRGDGLIIQKGHGFYPVDLTAPGVAARTDGYIYAYIVYGGKVMMPAYAENMPLPDDAWHAVNYIRRLQKESENAQGKEYGGREDGKN